MSRHIIFAAGLALALAAAPAHAAVSTQATAGARASTTRAPQATSRGGNPATGSTDALAALQDARVTLARLTEESKPHAAGEALDRVNSEFRALYKAYTGEEPQPDKTAAQAAASMKQLDPGWQKNYDTLSASIDRVLERAVGGQSGAVGTSGSAGTLELTTPVRQNVEVLRQQLQRFHKAAGGQAGTPVK